MKVSEADQLEYRILSLLRYREQYLKYIPILKEDLFNSKYTKYLLKLIKFYHKNSKGKVKAPLSSLFALVTSRIKPNEATKYKDVIRSIKRYPLNDDTVNDDIVKRFAKKQILKSTILEAINTLDHDESLDIGRLKERLDEAVLIDSTELLDSAYDYFSNPLQRLQESKDEPRIPLGLSTELDESLRGGMAAGTIGLIVAPTSVGKTMLLINVAYNAIKQGYKVVYVTLELSGREIAHRFDLLVTGKPYKELKNNPELVYKATKKLSKSGGGLKIKDSTSAKMSPNELGVYLERLRKDFKFDIVIIDQLDLMYSPKEYKERRHELSSIIISLRRMGASFKIPILSASQATRNAGEIGKTTLWDIAEDIGKANWADLIFTLSQSPEDKEENIMWLYTAKNRTGEGNPKVLLSLNYSTMKVKGQILKKKKG